MTNNEQTKRKHHQYTEYIKIHNKGENIVIKNKSKFFHQKEEKRTKDIMYNNQNKIF